MKHFTQTTANGLCTPPCGSSQGKSTSFNLRYSLLMLFLLLFVGTGSAVDGYYAVHGNNWQGTDGGQWNDNNNKARMSHQADGVYWCDKVAVSNGTTILFKILYGGGYDGSGFDWGNQKDATLIDNSRGNATLVNDNSDNRIQYTATENVDLYIYTNGSAIWANAVKQGSSSLSGKTIRLQGDLWTLATSGDWALNDCSPTLQVSPAGEKATTAFYIPAGMNDKYTKARWETMVNGTKTNYNEARFIGCSDDGSSNAKIIAKIQNSTSCVKYVKVEYTSARTTVTVTDAPAMTGNWYLWIDKVYKGQFVDGKIDIEDFPIGDGLHSIFVTNRTESQIGDYKNKTVKDHFAQGIEWLGGLYIDTDHSDVTTWNKGRYYKDASNYTKFSNREDFALINGGTDYNDARGGFQYNTVANVRFTLNNGVITINTFTPEPSPEPTTTYTVTLHPNNGGSNIVRENVPEGSTTSAAELNLAAITYGAGTATWYTNEACTEPFTSVTTDMHLYAKWGVSGNYYVAGSLWLQDNQTSGDWYNKRAKLMTYPNNGSFGTASVTYVGHRGKNVIEIIKDKDWGKSQRDLDSNSPVSLSIENNHIVFTLSEAKQVTVSYNGKVSVSTSDVSLGDYTIWRIKTNGWGGQAEWAHNLTLESDGTHIFRDVPAGGNKQFTVTKGSDDMENVGINVFHALYINTTIPTQPSALTWTMQTAKLDANAITIQAPQSDNFWRNGVFSLSEQSDLKLTFDGGNISIDVLPKYTVSFNSNGGSEVASQTMFEGRTASEPADPTRDGYEFDSWRISSVEGAEYNFESPVTANITLVAKWNQVIKHTVTFNSNDGSAVDSQEVADGEAASKPADPTKGGYVFSKWQLNGVDYNFSSAVNGDITLDAVWVAKTLESISLDHSSIVMVTGQDPVTLTPSYLPSDLIPAQQPTYDWSVSPTGVVNVSNEGVVSVVGEGTATVTCTAHGTDKSAGCVVTVKDCNTEPTDILSYTLGSEPTGIAAGSAAMNGMFDPASQSEPATLTKVRLALGNSNDYKYVYDPNTGVGAQLKYGDNNTDYAYWYRIEAGKTGSNIQIYVLKNVGTGKYLAKAAGGGTGNWDWVQAITANNADANTAKWHIATSSDQRLMNLDKSNGDGSYSTREYFLHRYNVNGSGTTTNQTVVVGSSDGNQGNGELKFNFRDESSVANPNYLQSPVDGYYRFATGANVVVTLNRAIKVNDVIRLEVKNPSDAAVSATVTIGSQVENISLDAGATSTETISVTDASRPTSITIASDDVNFMLQSVAVNREMPNPAKDPNLAWSATPSAAHQVADGDISSYIATRLGTGLITYTSSNESIATVAADGTVHPIAEGTVTITATLEQDGCYDGGSINYSLTLVDLPKPTITITANDEMPQGSYQTVTVAQNGDGALTFEITSGTGATLTDNGDGTYRLALAGNATDIVLTASTERTESYAQFSVTKNISVQQCYVDGHVIYEYELTGHADADGVAAEGSTYSQANLASVGTDDNPKTVTKIKLKFSKGNGNRIYAVDNGGNLRVQDEGNVDIAEWLLIPAGETVSNPFGTNASYPVYYVCNAKTGRYIYYGSTTSGSGDWVYTIAQLSSTNYKTNYYKWFIEVNNGETRIFSVQNRTSERKSSFKLNSANQYNSGYGSDVKNDHSLLCVGKMSDTNEYSRIYTDQGEMNVGSANNPDYFYSVENDNHTYYILNGGTVTVSRVSAFKAGDVITLNVFNRGAAAGNTIKVAENTIATNVNGAAALQYTVAEGDGIQGQNSFVITPLNGYICLSSISIFRPKDEDEFINPTLTWDADLSEQQIINMNNSETGMTHTIASIDAPVNAAVVYSVSPAGKANINSATGALTLTGEALNKDVLTVTATLPAIGCYNEAHATYEIYVKNLATPTLSAVFGTLQQGFASTLIVTTNSDAVPALSNISGFAVNGDPSHEGDNYTYNIVVNNTVESASVHVALSQTSDYLAAETDAERSVTTSSLEDLYENTPEGGTLVLDANYNEGLVINKAITIDGAGHSIGNLKVENEGDLTLGSALTVNDFTICTNAGNSEHEAASGQVRNATNLTANGNVYFLYTVDPSGTVHYGWYDFTVPFPVDVMTGIAGIAGIENEVLNEDFVNERDYAIMEHLGEKQANGEYSYKKFRGIMQPNKLYSITLDDDYNYNTVRFKKTNDGALVAGDNVTLEAHDGGVATRANWNGVGNGTLHHSDANLSTAEYIQIYQSGDKTFKPYNKNEISLVVGTAFMVQQAGGTMTLNQASQDELRAPARQESHQLSAISIQIAREDKPFSDQLFITANEDAEPVYTPGVDVAKAGNIGNVNVPQIWTNAYETKLCAQEAQLINGKAHYELSLYAPADGTYTMTSHNTPANYTLYLTNNGRAIWNLSINDTYSLDLTKGTHSEYGLMIVKLNNAPTEIDAISSQPSGSGKVIRNGILYILHNGKVFNAQGAVMK